MMHTILKRFAPVAALTLAFGVSACGSNMDISIGDTDGVPLAELDMSGDVPTGVVLAGPDTVIITDGDALDIQVEGDDEAVAELRFALEDNTLAISREKGGWGNKGDATIRVTMPSPENLVLAGSGTMEAETLAGDASVTIAGSGKAKTAAISAEELGVTVAGSGSYEAAGTTKTLSLTIAGSGSADMGELKADSASLTIAGSGDAKFASDGEVAASIVGAGNVVVTGDATCTVSSLGSGKVKCQTVKDDTSGDDSDKS